MRSILLLPVLVLSFAMATVVVAGEVSFQPTSVTTSNSIAQSFVPGVGATAKAPAGKQNPSKAAKPATNLVGQKHVDIVCNTGTVKARAQAVFLNQLQSQSQGQAQAQKNTATNKVKITAQCCKKVGGKRICDNKLPDATHIIAKLSMPQPKGTFSAELLKKARASFAAAFKKRDTTTAQSQTPMLGKESVCKLADKVLTFIIGIDGKTVETKCGTASGTNSTPGTVPPNGVPDPNATNPNTAGTPPPNTQPLPPAQQPPGPPAQAGPPAWTQAPPPQASPTDNGKNIDHGQGGTAPYYSNQPQNATNPYGQQGQLQNANLGREQNNNADSPKVDSYGDRRASDDDWGPFGDEDDFDDEYADDSAYETEGSGYDQQQPYDPDAIGSASELAVANDEEVYDYRDYAEYAKAGEVEELSDADIWELLGGEPDTGNGIDSVSDLGFIDYTEDELEFTDKYGQDWESDFAYTDSYEDLREFCTYADGAEECAYASLTEGEYDIMNSIYTQNQQAWSLNISDEYSYEQAQASQCSWYSWWCGYYFGPNGALTNIFGKNR